MTDAATLPRCRFCGCSLEHTFVDLGVSPLCESYLRADQLNHMEPFYPLHVHVCSQCYLVQLEEYVSPEHIFSEYAYFSSYADSWVQHCKRYVEAISRRLGLGKHSLVVELASNDGYLLQHFLPLGVPVLGIEPAANVAKVAQDRGIDTLVSFFGRTVAQRLSEEGRVADLVCANNVLAQVPDIVDFVGGLPAILKADGVVTFEFPHVMRLMAGNQFDTIYHEHFSYFSLLTTEKILAAHALTLFDVEELPTHGGSLRVYAQHAAHTTRRPVEPRVAELREREIAAGLHQMATYASFAERVRETKRQILSFLIEARRAGKTIAGYGAPGKGNTLLNYCGIRTDFIDYTVDRNPYKQGKYLPGSRIPIFAPQRLRETKPDYVVIMPWNFKDEILEQIADIRDWGGRAVVFIPTVEVY